MASMVPYDRYTRALRNWPFDALDSFFDAPFAPLSTSAASFKMNVEDAGDKYVVTAELPGVKREEIDVELNEGRLSISVNVEDKDEDKDKNYLAKEFTSYSATRGVYLKDAATEGLRAKLADGVLTFNVPFFVEKKYVTKISID